MSKDRKAFGRNDEDLEIAEVEKAIREIERAQAAVSMVADNADSGTVQSIMSGLADGADFQRALAALETLRRDILRTSDGEMSDGRPLRTKQAPGGAHRVYSGGR